MAVGCSAGDRDTRLYYYRHRVYAAKLGRFVSRDPVGYESGISLYLYVGGLPTLSRDPSGLKEEGFECNESIEGKRFFYPEGVSCSPKEPGYSDTAINMALWTVLLSYLPSPSDGKFKQAIGELITKLRNGTITIEGLDKENLITLLAKLREMQLAMNGGIASVWVKGTCHECRCTNWLQPIIGKQSWGWKKVNSGWVKCDLDSTDWGRKKPPGLYIGNDQIAFDLFDKASLDRLMKQCSDQVSRKCKDAVPPFE